MYKWIIPVAVVLAAFLWYQYRAPRFVTGEQAPDFQAVLKDGRSVKLSDLRGKYVLLQFWGSWCGPCRAENPGIVQLYQKYRPQGFEVFSIGIEQNENAWGKAIERDGMIWPWHSADLQRFDSKIARLYNIRAIPATFLLDPEGTILGVNLTPSEIDTTLRRQLATH
jgi:thiol-disulfide isomerase/thioredoxin